MPGAIQYEWYYIPTALNIKGYINQYFGTNKTCVYDLILMGTDYLHNLVVDRSLL
jgi:hypothetical protein